MSFDMWKSVFGGKCKLNQIRQRRYIVWSGTLLYFIMFYSTQYFYKRTVMVQIRLREDIFALPDPNDGQGW